LLLSLFLLAGNGFFVAAEFALVASKNYRLEQDAAVGRRGAQAALEGTRELSLMLAGAQLGITLCTLGLGALAEPALARTIDPALRLTGLPSQTSYVIAFVVSLVIVVFLHMVVGEMAPKSWAISHPERSATLLAPPFRAFTRAVRPILAMLNATANGLLRLVKVQPQDRLAHAHGPEALAILLEQSREHGTLEAPQHELLTRILSVSRKTVVDVMQPAEELRAVPMSATAEEVEQQSRTTGRSRLAVANHGHLIGWVHVRDAITAVTHGVTTNAAEMMTPLFRLPGNADLIDAVASLRAQRVQLAIVERDNETIGFVALEDLLEEIIGDFDDETDLEPDAGNPPLAPKS
jgi:CBS domain containing-hemolysin-like protein